MTPEHALMNAIRIECGRRGYVVIRTNVIAGNLVHADGTSRYVESGLPVGWPDLMVLRPDGVACFVETKIRPRKPTGDQLRVQALLRSMGFRTGTAYSVEEALEIIEKP